jgi:hypothetical protein
MGRDEATPLKPIVITDDACGPRLCREVRRAVDADGEVDAGVL